MRPLLRPGVPLVWRTDELLQLGTDPERAVALAAGEPAYEWLHSLDGSHELGDALRAATAAGVSPDEAASLLDALSAAGGLEDAGLDVPELRSASAGERDRLAPDVAAAALALGHPGAGALAVGARRRAMVEVRGAGRVGTAVAVLLAATGVGTLLAEGDGGEPVTPFTADLEAAPGSNRTRHAVERAAPSTRIADPAQVDARPDFVVLADHEHLDPESVAGLVAADVPHLLVHARGHRAVVGPLVMPGRTACLRCIHLSRRDRDPTWPRQAAQLLRSDETSPAPVDVLLATLAAALAARRVCGVLEADLVPGGPPENELPPGAGQAVEFDLLRQRFTTRSWAPHPICGCTWSG